MGLEQIGLEGVFKTEAFAKGLQTYTSGITKATGQTETAAESVGSKLSGAIIGTVASYLSLAAVLGTVTAVMKQGLEAAAEEETNLSMLNATVKSMGLSSEISGGNIRSMAEAMQAANGVFAHDDLERAAQSFLQIEGFDPSSLKRVLEVVQDFAAGTGTDAASAAQAIATALETGQTRSLHFTAALRAQIQEMIAAGDQAGALALILDTLNSKWGGKATAAMETYDGKIKILKNDWSEFLATLGGAELPEGKGILTFFDRLVVAMTATIGHLGVWSHFFAGLGLMMSGAMDEGIVEIRKAESEAASALKNTKLDAEEAMGSISDSVTDAYKTANTELEKWKGHLKDSAALAKTFSKFQKDAANAAEDLAKTITKTYTQMYDEILKGANLYAKNQENIADATQDLTDAQKDYNDAVKQQNASKAAIEAKGRIGDLRREYEKMVDLEKNHDANLNDVAEAQRNLNDAIAEGGAAETEAVKKAREAIEDKKKALEDARIAARDATNEMVAGFMQVRLAADGVFDENDMNKLLNYRHVMGLLSDDEYEAAKAAMALADALSFLPTSTVGGQGPHGGNYGGMAGGGYLPAGQSNIVGDWPGMRTGFEELIRALPGGGVQIYPNSQIQPSGGGGRTAPAKNTTNNVTINNPAAEPASTSVDRTLTRLNYLGIT